MHFNNRDLSRLFSLWFCPCSRPAVIAGSGIYQRFVKAAASYVVSFGPLAILIYVLYRVSRLA